MKLLLLTLVSLASVWCEDERYYGSFLDEPVNGPFCNEPKEWSTNKWWNCQKVKDAGNCYKYGPVFGQVCDYTCGLCKGPQRPRSVCKQTRDWVTSWKCIKNKGSEAWRNNNCDIAQNKCNPDCEDTPNWTSQHGRKCRNYESVCVNGSPLVSLSSGKGGRRKPEDNCCVCGKSKIGAKKDSLIKQAIEYYNELKREELRKREDYFEREAWY